MRAPNYAATVRDQIRAIEQERLRKLAAARAGEKGPHAMICLLARVIGASRRRTCWSTRSFRARCAIARPARYAGLTGAPDESGRRRREKGLARAGNARVRRGTIEFAWRFLRFQYRSALAQWFRYEPPTAAAPRARP